MAGTFEIFKDNGGEFRFRLKSGNGQVVLSSEGYSAKPGALGGGESVRTNCEDGSCFDRDATSAGKFRFKRRPRPPTEPPTTPSADPTECHRRSLT